MAKTNQKHKTVGVSFNPLVRQAANRRARQLGMSFSRYVSLCVEAEMIGRMPLPSPGDAQWEHLREVVRGQEADFAESTTEQLRADVADLLAHAQVPFTRDTLLGSMHADFWIDSRATQKGPQSTQAALLGNREQSAIGGNVRGAHVGKQAARKRESKQAIPCPPAAPTQGVAIECHYPRATSHAALLGRAVMLQQVDGVQAVLLCVPYLSPLAPELQALFTQQRISVTTPDTLLKALRKVACNASMPLRGR